MQTTLKKSKGHAILNTIIITGLIMIILGTYYYLPNISKITEPTTPEAQVELPTASEPLNEQPASKEMEPATSVINQPAVKLPLLDESDQFALTSAQQILSLSQHISLLIKQDIIRNVVVFIDNFSRGDLIANFSPFIKPYKPFTIIERNNKLYLNPESYQRYDIYADMVDAIDLEAAVQQYQTLQPLIDQAFAEIAYPNQTFADQMRATIELILDTPVIRGPIELIAPSVMYKFADQALEELPAAQKLLIRMGPENTLKIKAKLQQAQAALSAL